MHTTASESLSRWGAAEKGLYWEMGNWRSTRLARVTEESFDAMAGGGCRRRCEVGEENDGSSWRGVLRVVSQSEATDYSRLTKHSSPCVATSSNAI